MSWANSLSTYTFISSTVIFALEKYLSTAENTIVSVLFVLSIVDEFFIISGVT